jgi:hypothetical protein
VQRTINAPDWEWGEKPDVCRWLGIDRPAFDALLRAGLVPDGVRINRQQVVWRWDTVVGISLLLPFRLRLRGETGDENSPEVG